MVIKITLRGIEFCNNHLDLINRFYDCMENHFEKRGQVGKIEQDIMNDVEKSLVDAGFDEEIINIAYGFAIVCSAAKIGVCPLPVQDHRFTTNRIKEVLEGACTGQETGHTAVYSFDILMILTQENFKLLAPGLLQNREQILSLLDKAPSTTTVANSSNKLRPS